MYRNNSAACPLSASKKLLTAVLALLLSALVLMPGCAADEPAPDAANDTTTTQTDAAGAADTNATAGADAAANASADAGTIEVAVSITMPESANADSKTIDVTIPEGGTVYDALQATGWEVVAEDSEYGKFVTSINGIENGSEGEMSGWMFTVNQEQIMEGCDSCVLSAGDSVEWSFFV